VARTGESRVAYRDLVAKFKGNRPLARPRRRWEDNFKMDGVVDCVVVAQDMENCRAFVNTVMNLRIMCGDCVG
jgi:hypothetical protein